jgi:hypothetical protein
MKTKVITKVDAYKQVDIDFKHVIDKHKILADEANEIGTIGIRPNFTINRCSSETSFVFAIGVLRSNVSSCEELGIDPSDYKEKLDKVKRLFQLQKEIQMTVEFKDQLYLYKYELYNLLTSEEKFLVMKYPTIK